jgi:hypothetical protein
MCRNFVLNYFGIPASMAVSADFFFGVVLVLIEFVAFFHSGVVNS